MSDVLGYILSRVITPRSDCMIWPGAVERGYGRVQVDGVTKRVHRVVWELANGPVPAGLTIDHLCRVTYCCNVAHMELVTPGENVRRAVPYRPQRRAFTTRSAGKTLIMGGQCRNGHPIVSTDDFYEQRSGRRRCKRCRLAVEAARRERRRRQTAESASSSDGEAS